MAGDVKKPSDVQWCFKYSNMTGFSLVLSWVLVAQPVYLQEDLRTYEKGDFSSTSLRGSMTLKAALQTHSLYYFQHFLTRLQRLSHPCKRRKAPVHPTKTTLLVCATLIQPYKPWIPFPSLFPCLCHVRNTDPHWTGLCCSLDLLPVWSRCRLSCNGPLSYFQSLRRTQHKNREKENGQPQMKQPPQQLLGPPRRMPSAPVHFWLAHQPSFHRTKVSIGKMATLRFRGFSSVIAKKDHGLTQRMVCTEAARFFSAATSGVYRAGIFFLDHCIFLQLVLELQFCNCFLSLLGGLRSQTMKKDTRIWQFVLQKRQRWLNFQLQMSGQQCRLQLSLDLNMLI